MLLEKLSGLSGVSGNEYEVRNFIRQRLEKSGIDYKIDGIGNIIAHNTGRKADEKVLICGYMDEIGFMVTGIDDKGFIKFKAVGQSGDRLLSAKAVEIGQEKIGGVIGSKALHLMDRKDIGKVTEIKDLYIDIGSTGKEETEKRVQIGDYINFKSKYLEFGNNSIKSRAIDSRAVCSVLIDILEKKVDLDFYVAFTVLGKIEGLGNMTSEYGVKPDITISLGGITCKPDKKEIPLFGGGPVVSYMADDMISDIDLTEFVKKIARENDMEVQMNAEKGRMDDGFFRKNDIGSKHLSITLPCKYMDSGVSCINKDDLKRFAELIENIINEMEKKNGL